MKNIEKYWGKYFDERARRFGGEARTLDAKSDRIYYYRRDAIISSLREMFAPLKGKKILDVGCGNGLFTKLLVNENKVFGIDISEEMLKLAKGNGLEVVRGSVLSLPFESNSFDIVISAGVVQYFESSKDMEDMTLECARVAKPGGAVLIETISAESLIRNGYNILRSIMAPGVRPKPFKASDVWKSMEKSGLKVSSVIYLYYPITYKRKLVSNHLDILNRFLSTAFAIVGVK